MESIFIYLLLSFSLITLNDVWGQLDFTYLLPKGEAYDFFFVIAVVAGIALFICRYKSIKLSRDIKVILVLFLGIIFYCMINGVYCVMNGTQSAIQTILVLREVLYISVVPIFVAGNYNSKKALQIATVLDCIGCLIAIAEIAMGPLSPLRVNGKYEVGVNYWRSYSDVPTLAFILCPLLIYGIGEGKYLFGKWIDCTILLLLMLTKVLKMSRISIFSLLVVCTIAFLFCKGIRPGIVVRQMLWLILVGIIGTVTLGVTMPQLFVRFRDGIIGILHLNGASNSTANTMSIRWKTMWDRWNYLGEHNRLFWGMGPMHNDLELVLGGGDTWPNNGVVAPDIAYAAILFRYGLIGMFIFVGNLLVAAVVAWKNTNLVMKSFGLFLLASLIEGLSSHSSLAFGAFFKIGILFGIAWKSISQEEQNGEKISEGSTH